MKNGTLEKALEVEERGREKKGENIERGKRRHRDRGGLDRHLITTE